MHITPSHEKPYVAGLQSRLALCRSRLTHSGLVYVQVNGVAAIHADIIKADVFPHFVEYYKKKGKTDKFIGITNGVTCRRYRVISRLFYAR